MKLFYTFQEIKSCEREKDEVDFLFKNKCFLGSAEFLLSGYDIKSTCKMKEGTVPVHPYNP
jgi:hypothetical protein